MNLIVAMFIGVLALVLGAFWLFVVRHEAGAQRAIQKRLRPQEEAARKRGLTVAKAGQKEGVTLFRNLQETIDQSGRSLTVPGLLFMCAMAGVITGVVVWMSSGVAWLSMLAAVAAMTVPYMVVKRLAGRRMWKFEEQFPEAIELVARALRAGHAFPTGLSMVADELGDPVGPEFKLLHDRQNFGMPMPDALRSFAARVPIIDAKFFVTAVLTQREAGGNLSGVLDNLGSVIRERFKVKRQVGVISAHGKMTAAILSGLPVFVVIAQFFMAPQNAKMLFADPIGQYMLMGAVGLWAVGMLWIRKVMRIEY
jgi:tight adherence protein B